MFFLSVVGAPAIATPQREVAITIDDLPYVGTHYGFQEIYDNTVNLLTPIKKNKVPVVGFVIGFQTHSFTDEQSRSLYRLWLGAGAELGNHTWTHPDLNTTPMADYQAEILKTEAEIHRLMGPMKVRYFRAPYLHEGPDAKTRDELHRFLAAHHYQDGVVTLDDDDYLFAGAYNKSIDSGDMAKAKRVEDVYIPYMKSIVEFFEGQSRRIFGREIPQVLLIHANKLNGKMMPALLQMFKDRNYRFVTLAKALADKAYRTPDGYIGKNGISWLHRWGLAKGMKIEWEPDGPDWIEKPSP